MRPDTDASVRTRVVSWNEAAEMKDAVCSEALVMPSSTGFEVAGSPPSASISALWRFSSAASTCSAPRKRVSPGSSISTFCSIWRMMTSMCLSSMCTPWSR